jgi:hypothetical protein
MTGPQTGAPGIYFHVLRPLSFIPEGRQELHGFQSTESKPDFFPHLTRDLLPNRKIACPGILF